MRLIISLSVLLAFTVACKTSEAPAEKAGEAKQKLTSADGGTAAKTSEGAAADSTLSPLELQREKVISGLILEMLGSQHIRKQGIDDGVSKKAFKAYLESLDPAKLFMLKSDVDTLKKHTETLDDELKAGRLEMAEAGAGIIQRRIKVTGKLVEELLLKPFDYKRNETFETDPEKRKWCETEADLRERWRKVLKSSVIRRIVRYEEAATTRAEAAAKGEKPDREEDILDKAPETAEAREVKARTRTAKNWKARFTRLEQQVHTDEIELFYNAIAGAFDPHTAFLPPARKENFDIQMSGSLEGIGAVLSEHESFIRIVRIVPGSASWRQGDLEAGDLILSVAQGEKEAVDVVDMRLRDVVRLIRGPKGSQVVLTVKKPDDRVLVIPITRDVVKIEASYAKGALLKDKAGLEVGYIDLPSFYGNTRSKPGSTPERSCTEDVRKLLDIYEKKGVKHVILDLRRNGGGLLSDARKMSGLFIEKGPIVQTMGVGGDKEILADTDASVTFKGHVVVLVDRFSASASEILAGALQDYGRAVVVGSPQTHGKGTVQMLMSLDRLVDPSAVDPKLRPLGVFKLTRQQFFRISGSSTQNRGVIPDIVFADPSAHIESGERYLDNAIPWSSLEKLPFSPWKRVYDMKALGKKSETRRAENAAFKRAKSRVDLLAKLRKETVDSLDLDKYRTQSRSDRDQLEALSPELEKVPEVLTVAPVNYSGDKSQAALEEATDRRTGQPRKDVWQDSLERDHWVEESMRILSDMAAEP